MTPQGRAFVLNRLTNAPDKAALKRVWESLNPEYTRDPEIQQHKNKLKEEMRECQADKP